MAAVAGIISQCVAHSSRFVVLALALTITLPAQRRLPTPASVFGFEPGADNKLATYDQVVDYFKKVDAASDRVKLVEAGTSTQGRTYYFALVSSKENLERHRPLPRDRAAARASRRADAMRRRGSWRAKARRSSTSTAGCTRPKSPARSTRRCCSYDLLTRATARTRTIEAMLDNVILMLWPTINPDGQQMVAEWHM